MRHILKRTEPRELTNWRASCIGGPNYDYDSIDGTLRATIRRSLVEEQRSLCAYTGRRISEETCHIEHLKPQARRESGEDVAYRNMVACVPKSRSALQLPYGAHKKGSWPASIDQDHLFVSPLEPTCESRFTYTVRGEIRAAREEDKAATTTIEKLGLDHDQLKALRKAAIEETLRFPGDASARLRNANQRLNALLREINDDGPLQPFCFVLKQVLEKEIKKLEAIRDSRR